MNQKYLPNPETRLAVIKRYLHVLALLQSNRDPVDWNANTLADLLSLDEHGDPLTDKTVRDYINDHLIREFNLGIEKQKGGRRTELQDPIPGEILSRVLNVYSSFVVNDSTRDMILKKLIASHPYDAMWLLGRIYFAALARKKISFDYTTNKNSIINGCVTHPYQLVFRNNNLYLTALSEYSGNTQLYIVNKIENMKVLDDRFTEEPQKVEKLFSDTLGSFIGTRHNVTIRYSKTIRGMIDQMLFSLEPDITNIDETTIEASFVITDEAFLCKQLFVFGRNVEILEPASLRTQMRSMLEEGLTVYK